MGVCLSISDYFYCVNKAFFGKGREINLFNNIRHTKLPKDLLYC